MSHKGIRLLHVNTRSIFKKLALLNTLYNRMDVVCCTETWLDDRLPDSLIRLDNMKIYRCDRKKGINDYNVHIVGRGVCIFVNEKWSDYTKYMKDFSNVMIDYEIVTLTITRPNFRKLLIACVYKPPKGKIENCIKFLKDLVVHFQNLNYEIWLLGDFNTDLLRRDDIHSIELLRFIRQTGLKQLIEGITRPNKRGGSCIDLIMSDCIYVQESGILDDLVADHYSVYCVRKKKREHRTIITKMIRDYSNFDENDFGILLTNKDWEVFDNLLDLDRQWEIIIQYVMSILTVMPSKQFYVLETLSQRHLMV